MIITSLGTTTIDGINNYYNKVYDQSALLDGRPGNDYQGGTLYPQIIVESDHGNNDNRKTDNIVHQGNCDSSLYGD
jgi:hypothetical protein